MMKCLLKSEVLAQLEIPEQATRLLDGKKGLRQKIGARQECDWAKDGEESQYIPSNGDQRSEKG